MARARMTRQELKTQDEFMTTVQRFSEIAYARKKELLIGAGAILVLILVFVGWRAYSRNRDAGAQAQLAAAIAAYNDSSLKSDKERYEKTIVEGQKTVDAYGSRPSAMIARYYIGMAREGLGDTPGAAKILQEVASGGDSNIKPVAQFALAGIHERHGELKQAIDTLKPLYDSGAYTKGTVAFELGKLYEANKQPDQAKVYYERVIIEATDSPFREDAEAGLKRMGFPLPTPTTVPAPAK